MSAVRVVDELLEPGGVFGDEPGKPGGVDEAEGKKIAQVSAVFVAEGVELHPTLCHREGKQPETCLRRLRAYSAGAAR